MISSSTNLQACGKVQMTPDKINWLSINDFE